MIVIDGIYIEREGRKEGRKTDRKERKCSSPSFLPSFFPCNNEGCVRIRSTLRLRSFVGPAADRKKKQFLSIE